MNENIAVKINHVSKFFKLPIESTNSLRTLMINRLKGVKGFKEQHVLKDISFEVEKGDFFGIIGRNGSGKSTLLKIISQIYTPEQGTVDIEGKLVSFIELGVGFNPELTGRENVYLNGAMLGFSKLEIDDMYDEIVDFAELHEFMSQKLKNYSSGMQVRLAFSVAIKARGDVLVLDEVLAVGDEAFQRKCNDYFWERKKSGQTTILVTHDMSAVQKYCNKAIYIKNGVIENGSIQDITNKYSSDNFSQTVEKSEDEEIAELTLKPLANLLLTSSDDYFKAKIEYEIHSEEFKKNKEELYIAYTLHDVKRGGIIYDSGAIPIDNIDDIIVPMENFHNTTFGLIASLRKKKRINENGFVETEFVTASTMLNFIYRDTNDKKDYALLKEIK